MRGEIDGYTESECLNYGKSITAVLKQHNLLAPGEAESIAGGLYYC
jgi:hypothetical protein